MDDHRPLHPAAMEAAVERRSILRALGGGAVVLAACSGSPTSAAPDTTAGPAGTVTAPAPNTDAPWWLQGNFAPVDDEIEAFDLEVKSSLPPELTGLYVRNGSNPLDGSPHWFLGHGMVHGVRLDAGSATWYRNGFVFHGTNAWNDGDLIHLDISRIDQMFAEEEGENSLLHRWTIDMSGDEFTVTESQLEGRSVDFPKVDERLLGRPHRHAWYVMPSGDFGDGGLSFDGLAHRDTTSGDLATWESGPELQPGEAYFVPATEGAAEGEGWLLSYAYDRANDRSELIVLDALDVPAGPVGSVVLPRRVPYGFHGTWVPEVGGA